MAVPMKSPAVIQELTPKLSRPDVVDVQFAGHVSSDRKSDSDEDEGRDEDGPEDDDFKDRMRRLTSVDTTSNLQPPDVTHFSVSPPERLLHRPSLDAVETVPSSRADSGVRTFPGTANGANRWSTTSSISSSGSQGHAERVTILHVKGDNDPKSLTPTEPDSNVTELSRTSSPSPATQVPAASLYADSPPPSNKGTRTPSEDRPVSSLQASSPIRRSSLNVLIVSPPSPSSSASNIATTPMGTAIAVGHSRGPSHILTAKAWGPERTIELHREPNKSLGISIVGGKVDLFHVSPGNSITGIFIKNVLLDSPAGRNGTLKTGDRILEVRKRCL